MSDPGAPPGPAGPSGQPRARRRITVSSRTVLVAVLAVLAVVFVVQNRQETEIRAIVPELTMPLWLALLATLLIGWVIGYLGRRRRR